MNIAFVGVGRMGANMARRLKDCGFNVTAIADRNPTAATELAQEIGARACTDLAQVTAAADVIFTVVSDDAAMHAVFREDGPSLLTAAQGKVFVNCATIAPSTHREIDARVQRAWHRAFPRRDRARSI